MVVGHCICHHVLLKYELNTQYVIHDKQLEVWICKTVGFIRSTAADQSDHLHLVN